MIVSLHTAATGINVHIARGILMGIVQSNHEKIGKYLYFHVLSSVVRSWYQRIKFSCQATTTSRSVITHSLWIEVIVPS